MTEVTICNPIHKEAHFRVSHCFNNKVFVIWEKEETTTSSTCFPCLEHTRTIKKGIKWINDLIVADAILMTESRKALNKKSFNYYIFIEDNQISLVKFLINFRCEWHVRILYKLLLPCWFPYFGIGNFDLCQLNSDAEVVESVLLQRFIPIGL